MTEMPTIDVRQHAESLLKEAETGAARPTITELARRSGITRPTLYRNHPDIVTDFLARAAKHRHVTPPAPKPTQHLTDKITRLRRENSELRLHVEIYEEHIRRLTMQNARLSGRLADLDNVVILGQRRSSPPIDRT